MLRDVINCCKLPEAQLMSPKICPRTAPCIVERGYHKAHTKIPP